MDPFHLDLEVKYNGFLLSYIKDLLDQVNVQNCPSVNTAWPEAFPLAPRDKFHKEEKHQP